VVIGILIAVALLALLVVSLFVRRHRESNQPSAGWQRTDEIFNDPSTNRVMRVWVDQAGERRYVVDQDRPAT
jgi:FtsZ-interacting cell division protein ZipA